MTHNDFCKVISETEKSVKCVKLGNKILDGGGYSGREMVDTSKEYGKEFRLLKRACNDGVTRYVGSYPFCDGSDSKRKDSFSEVSEDSTFYYNTMD
jgi:hypothetical protein